MKSLRNKTLLKKVSFLPDLYGDRDDMKKGDEVRVFLDVI